MFYDELKEDQIVYQAKEAITKSSESEYVWLNEISKDFLQKDYLLPNETLDQRVNIICKRAEEILKIPGFGESFKQNLKKGWYSLSSPIWSNFGTNRGSPISCFGVQIYDSMESILENQAIVGAQTKIGGGTSGDFSKLRPRGAEIKNNGKTSGAVHFMKLFDTLTNIISQGSVRRGSFAAYLSVDHFDIMEFLALRSEGNPIQDLSFGVTIPDGWMESMLKEVGKGPKKTIWAKIIETRTKTGFPYIVFLDNANSNTVDVYKDKELKITHSNLCSEIMLPDNEEESFVCDLSSMNLVHFDDWKNTNAVELLTFFLDAVMTEFIDKSRNIKFMEANVRFAERHRAIGIGALGFHSLLQSKMIAFESIQAKILNSTVFKTIKESAYKASAKLATLYGEPEVLRGYGRRNTTLMAIAPTKSSAQILGQVSEGIEAFESNSYIKDLAKGKFTFRNPYLEKLLGEKDKNTDEVWRGILSNRGSVQHLDFLSDHEKNVFKTSSEISQKEVIILAAARQKFIDQGQSLNLMFHPMHDPKDLNQTMIEGWRLGVKSYYYHKNINAAQELSRELLDCASCSA